MQERTTAVTVPVLVLALAVVLALAGCGASGNPVQPSSSPALTGFNSSALTVAPGATAAASVQLNAAATLTTTVTLTSSNPSVATVPDSVTVPIGSTTGSFTVSAIAPGSATITAILNGAHQTMQITVSATAAIASLQLDSTTVTGGNVVNATVTLTNAAGAGGALVTLSAEDPAAVPPSVVVPAGTTSVPFAVTTHGVQSAKAAHITATYGGASASVVLTVNPPATAEAHFGVTGTSETDTCALINGGTALDCTFNGSTSMAPATITAWVWTYGVTSMTSQTTNGAILASPAFNCSLAPPPPLPAGATSLTMTVKLVVHDSAGNVSPEAVHTDVRLLPNGACGY